MSVTVGELFINLGVKGSEKAEASVKSVSDGLQQTASFGLAAKAAIVATVYGLERLTASLAAQGQGLAAFGAFTGASVEKLQRWQYVLRQSGVEAEEVSGAVKGLQQSMANMLLGKGAPEGLAMVANTVGFDVTQARDSFYVLDKLREYAKATAATPDVTNRVLGSFGLGEGMIQALRAGKMTIDQVKPSQIFSSNEVSQLQRINTAWSNFYNTLRMISGHLVAGHGMKGISALQGALEVLIRAGSGIKDLQKEFQNLDKVMIAIGVSAAAAFAPVTTAISSLVFLLSEYNKATQGKETFFSPGGKMDKFLETIPGGEALIGFFDSMSAKTGKQVAFDSAQNKSSELLRSGWRAPLALPKTGPGASNTMNTTINNYVDTPKNIPDVTEQTIRRATMQRFKPGAQGG